MCGRFNQWRIRRTSKHVAARPTQLSRTGWPLSPKYVKLKACVQHTIIPVEEGLTGSSVTSCSLLFCVLCVSSGFSSACFLITSSNRQLFTNLISVVYSLIKKALLYTGKIVRRFVSFENFVALQDYKHIGKLLRNRQQFSIRFQVRTMLFCSTAGEHDSDLSGAEHTREETVSLLRTLSSTQFLSH